MQAEVRIIFSVIAEHRLKASEVTITQARTAARGGQIIWAALQANKEQRRFMLQRFKGHSALAPLLCQYLFDVVAFSDEVKKLREMLLATDKTAKEAKSKADGADSKATKALNKK